MRKGILFLGLFVFCISFVLAAGNVTINGVSRPMTDGEQAALMGGLAAMGVGLMIFWLVMMVGSYVFSSLIFMSIAKKLGQKSPGIAWIPGFGPVIVIFKASGMKAWPWFLLIVPVIVSIIALISVVVGIVSGSVGGLVVMGLLMMVLSFVAWLSMIAFGVFNMIWLVKMLLRFGKSTAWILVFFLVPLASTIMLIMLAWGKSQPTEKKESPKKESPKKEAKPSKKEVVPEVKPVETVPVKVKKKEIVKEQTPPEIEAPVKNPVNDYIERLNKENL